MSDSWKYKSYDGAYYPNEDECQKADIHEMIRRFLIAEFKDQFSSEQIRALALKLFKYRKALPELFDGNLSYLTKQELENAASPPRIIILWDGE